MSKARKFQLGFDFFHFLHYNRQGKKVQNFRFVVLKLMQLARNCQVEWDSKSIQARVVVDELRVRRSTSDALRKAASGSSFPNCIRSRSSLHSVAINTELQQHISLNTALYKYYTTYYSSMIKMYSNIFTQAHRKYTPSKGWHLGVECTTAKDTTDTAMWACLIGRSGNLIQWTGNDLRRTIRMESKHWTPCWSETLGFKQEVANVQPKCSCQHYYSR